MSEPPDAPPRAMALGLYLACVGIGAALRPPPLLQRPIPLDDVFARGFGTALGWPVLPAPALVYAVLGAGILIAGLRLLRREGNDAWLLFLFTVAVAPLAAFGVLRPETIAVRHWALYRNANSSAGGFAE